MCTCARSAAAAALGPDCNVFILPPPRTTAAPAGLAAGAIAGTRGPAAQAGELRRAVEGWGDVLQALGVPPLALVDWSPAAHGLARPAAPVRTATGTGAAGVGAAPVYDRPPMYARGRCEGTEGDSELGAGPGRVAKPQLGEGLARRSGLARASP